MYIYYPSCNFAISSPQTAKKVREYLKEKMDIANVVKLIKENLMKKILVFMFVKRVEVK